MMLGVDTNVLIYAHIPALAQHATVRAHLLELLADPDVVLAITPAVIHELVHVITDARRFDPPVTMAEAVATARLYLRASNVECLATDGDAARLALELLDRHRLGRKRLADTLFAATLLTHGVGEVVTCNPSDFTLFEGLATIDPLG
jgi:predicted nucleic acid-binding protein